MLVPAVADEFSLAKTIEALRATRELDVNLSGLKALHGAVRQPGRQGWEHLLSYIRSSPSCWELTNIWEAQATIKDPRVFPELLLLISHAIAAKPPPQPPHDAAGSAGGKSKGRKSSRRSEVSEEASKDTAAAAQEQFLVEAAQQSLITQTLGRRLKTLYNCLGSDDQRLTNSALQLLAAVAAHSGTAARDLASTFDWSLTALTRICRPAKPSAADQHKQDAQVKAASGRDATAWNHPNVLSRPRRALFVALCRALIDSADHATLARLLPLRSLTGGLMNHLAADPPAQAFETLTLLARRVLAPAAAGLPPRLRAEPFGDAALGQLAQLAAASDEPAATEAAPPPVVLAAEAALEVLVMLCTDPDNGLVTHGPVVTTALSAVDGGGAAAAAAPQPQFGSGVKRLLRLLPRLQPLERVRHARLLNEVADRCPWLAAEFVSSLPYDLQPRAGSRWVAAMTLAARLTAAAAVAPSPLLARLAAAAASGGVPPPPAFTAPQVRAHLRCCLPPALSKAVLSRGVQHNRPVVQALTLDALASILRSIAPLVAAVRAGHAAASGSPSAAAWANFHRRLCSTIRSRLPDLQTLLALHAALEKQQGEGAEAAAGGKAPRQQGDAADGASEMQVDPPAAEATAGDKGADDEDEDNGEEEEDDEEGGGSRPAERGGSGELAAAVFGAAVAAQPQRVRAAVLVRLLDAVAGYCRLVPEAAADAHLDAVRLLPPDMLQLDERHQQALLGVLEAASPADERGSTATAAAAVAAPLNTALVSPLLRLLTRAASPTVRTAAGELLLRRARALVGGTDVASAPTAGACPLLPATLAGGSGNSSGASDAALARLGCDELELRMWLWMLPALPPALRNAAHGAAEDGTAAAAAADSGSGGGATLSAANEDRAWDAVLGFLADVLVGASRRPQDGYELTQAWLPPPTAATAATAAGGPGPAAEKGDVASKQQHTSAASLSPLPAVALRNCLRLLRSQRAGGEGERAAVAAYVAGVLHLLLQQQSDPWVMLHLLERALRGDAQAGADGCEIVVTLPSEARPLKILYEWAVRHCTAANVTSTDVAAAPEAAETLAAAEAPPAKRRRKSSSAADATASPTAVSSPSPWGLGCLRVVVGASEGGGGAGGDEEGFRQIAKQLRASIKAAAAAVKSAIKEQAKIAAKGGSEAAPQGKGAEAGPLPEAARFALAAAAPAAAQLMSRGCAEPSEAAEHAVRLLQLAVQKALPSSPSAAATPAKKGAIAAGDGGDPWVSLDGLAGRLIASLWSYVLAKPLVSLCLGPADVLRLAQERREAADDEDGAAAAAEQGAEAFLPTAAALVAATAGCPGSVDAGAARQDWDAQLVQLLLWQTSFRLTSHVGPESGGGMPDFGAVLGTPAVAAPSPALLAAARSLPFWLPLLPADGDVAAAFQLVRQLLPAAKPAAKPTAKDSSLQVSACGALCHVLLSPALRGLLAPRLPSVNPQPAAAAAAPSSTTPCRTTAVTAARRYAVGLLTEVLRLPEGTTEALLPRGGSHAAAAVHAFARRHVATAAHTLLDVLRDARQYGTSSISSSGGAGGMAAVEAAITQLLPLLQCAAAPQLLPLVEQVLAAAEALPYQATGAAAPGGDSVAAAGNADAISGSGKKSKKSTAKRAKSLSGDEQACGPAGNGLGLLAGALRLAAALLKDPRPLLGGLAGGESDRELKTEEAGASEDQTSVTAVDATTGRDRVYKVFAVVQSLLSKLLPLALERKSEDDDGSSGTLPPAVAEAAEALRAGLLGPAGHLLALGMAEAALEDCVRLAPYSPAAADAAAASLALGPPALHARFAAALPAAVSAAEQRLPGSGRRVALARLLPAAESYIGLKEAAAREATDAAAAEDTVIHAYRDALLAYATRKRRKSSSAAAAATAAEQEREKEKGMPADALALLRSLAVPVLSRMLRLTTRARDKASDAAEDSTALLQRTLPKLLPPAGAPFSQDRDDDATDPAGQPPFASSSEQLALAEALLQIALYDSGVASAADLAAVGSVMGAAAATLACLYDQGVLPSSPAAGDKGQRRLLSAASRCLDGCVGDLLANTPDTLRSGTAFAAVCTAAAPLVASTAAHAARDPAAVRCVRRLLAALLPQAASAAAADSDAADAVGGESEEVSSSDSGSGSSTDEEVGGDAGVESESEESDEDQEEMEVEKVAEDEAKEEEEDEGGERKRKSRGAAAGGSGSSDSDDDEDSSDSSSSSSEDADGSTSDSDGGDEAGVEKGVRDAQESSSSEDEEKDEDTAAVAAAAKDPDVEMADAEAGAGAADAADVKDAPDIGGPLQLPYAIVPNAAVATAAAAMLEALVTSRELPSIFAPLESAPPLPPAIARAPLPLVSLLSLGDADEAMYGNNQPPYGQHGQQQGQEAAAVAAAANAKGEAARTELATLLETLIDMRLAYDVYDQYGNRRDGDGSSGGGDVVLSRPFGHAPVEQSVMQALLQLLQCTYGATLRDRALLRAMLRLDDILLLAQAQEGGQQRKTREQSGSSSSSDDDEDGEREGTRGAVTALSEADPVTRRLAGPLARSGFLWGAAAKQYYQSAANAAAISAGQATSQSAASSASPQAFEQSLRALQSRALAEHHPPEPRALALACVHFPAGRTLAADEDDPWVIPGAGGSASGNGAASSAAAVAAMDPAWLLPFAVCALRNSVANVKDLAGWGVLPLCLRCLASDDARLRTLSYEALELAAAQIDALAAAAAAAPAAAAAVVVPRGPAALGTFALSGDGGGGGGGGKAVAAAGAGRLRAAADFRQRPQLQVLLAHVRNAVVAPLQQLPHCSALLAAEAAAVLMQPQGPMYKPITRMLGRRPALDLTVPPLFNRVLASGAPGQRHEQTWALQLLRWGVLGPLDASICRRKFVAEVCTALHGSKAAALDANGGGGGGGGGETAAASLPLAVVCSLAALPSLGRHLVLHTGIAPWLAHVATSALQPHGHHHHLPAPGAASGLWQSRSVAVTAAPLPAAAAAALATLQGLVSRRVCLRRQDGDAAVLQYAQAAGLLAAAAGMYGSGGLAARVCDLVVALAAALPPWRAQPLWRLAVTPSVLLRLYDTISAAAVAAPSGEAEAWLGSWLQVVLRSSFPLGNSTTGASASAASAVPTADGHCSALQHLIRTAVGAALALTKHAAARVNGFSEPPTIGAADTGSQLRMSGGAGAAVTTAAAAVVAPAGACAVARACLMWVSSLAASGHCICWPAAASADAATAGGGDTGLRLTAPVTATSAAAVSLSELLCELCAAATAASTAGFERDTAGGSYSISGGGGGSLSGCTVAAVPSTAASARVVLWAHAECQRALRSHLLCGAVSEQRLLAVQPCEPAVKVAQNAKEGRSAECGQGRRSGARSQEAVAWLRAASLALEDAMGLGVGLGVRQAGPEEGRASRWEAAEAGLLAATDNGRDEN